MGVYSRQQWYTPAEVAVHNNPDDCWVALNGKVLDMTSWLKEQLKVCKCMKKTCSCKTQNWFCGEHCFEKCRCFHNGFLYCDARRLPMAILAFAGKDVSHWFQGEKWIHQTHAIITSETPYYRFGPGISQPVVPSTRWRPYVNPWWLDQGLVIGNATARTRPIRIVNTLTGSTVTLEVCSEETIYEIMMRYLPHNIHMHSYAWRYRGRRLCYDRTLEENGIQDERDLFSEVALAENVHIPAIFLYYNDDLTDDPVSDQCFCPSLNCQLKRPEKCHPNF